jgi:hypothetical protein
MKILFAILVFALMFGCLGPEVISVGELSNSTKDHLGEQVYVRGTVKDSFKLGKFSGFELVDDNGAVLVSSDELPKEGTEVVIQGTVMKEMFVGYYLLAKEIN